MDSGTRRGTALSRGPAARGSPGEPAAPRRPPTPGQSLRGARRGVAWHRATRLHPAHIFNRGPENSASRRPRHGTLCTPRAPARAFPGTLSPPPRRPPCPVSCDAGFQQRPGPGAAEGGPREPRRAPLAPPPSSPSRRGVPGCSPRCGRAAGRVPASPGPDSGPASSARGLGRLAGGV